MGPDSLSAAPRRSSEYALLLSFLFAYAHALNTGYDIIAGVARRRALFAFVSVLSHGRVDWAYRQHRQLSTVTCVADVASTASAESYAPHRPCRARAYVELTPVALRGQLHDTSFCVASRES